MRAALTLSILLSVALAGCAARVDTVCGVYRGHILVQEYAAKRPVRVPAGLKTEEQGRCVAKNLLAALTAKGLGGPAGYKVALTSKAAQDALGIDRPIAGVLLRHMLLADNSTVRADWGARPVFEPDLLVTVGDAAINDAETPLDVLRHISAIRPFIELADLAVPEGTPLTLPIALALNAGARLGVAGAPIPFAATEAFADTLGSMAVVARDARGREISRAPGSALLGHPLNAVIWLASELKRQGRALKAGQVVSLGAFAAPRAPVAGDTVTVRYEGLAADTLDTPEVRVRFR